MSHLGTILAIAQYVAAASIGKSTSAKRDAGHAKRGMAHRLTQSYTGILDAMLLADMKVACRADFDVNQQGARELPHIWSKKPIPVAIFGDAGAIEIDAKRCHALGPGLQSFAAQPLILYFAAIVAGRTRFNLSAAWLPRALT